MHIGERREWGGKYSRRSGQLIKTLLWENSVTGKENRQRKRKWEKIEKVGERKERHKKEVKDEQL